MTREPLVHPERRPAWVTGASSGIGAATALAFGAIGQPVVLAARRIEALEKLAADIRAAGGEAAAVALDMTDPASIAQFVKGAETAFGPAEILVSNAGDTQPGRAYETDPESFAHQVDVNLVGVQRLLTHVVPGMVERRRGDIVLVSSDVVVNPRPRMAGYVSAKWGVDGLGHALQMELERTGVRASLVRPGPTATEMGTSWSPEELTDVIADWQQWGLARHSGYLAPSAVAEAIVTVATAPRGSHYRLLEIDPEGPLRRQEPSPTKETP